MDKESCSCAYQKNMKKGLRESKCHQFKTYFNEFFKKVCKPNEPEDVELIDKDDHLSIYNSDEFNSNNIYNYETIHPDVQLLCPYFCKKDKAKRRIKDERLDPTSVNDKFDAYELMNELFGDFPSGKTYFEVLPSKSSTDETVHKSNRNKTKFSSKIEQKKTKTKKMVPTEINPLKVSTNKVEPFIVLNQKEFDNILLLNHDLLFFKSPLSYMQIFILTFYFVFAFLFCLLYLKERNKRYDEELLGISQRKRHHNFIEDLR